MDAARHMKISTVATVLGVFLAAIAILATFVVPEIRCWSGLDKPDKCQGPVAVPSPLSPGKEGNGVSTSSPATVEPSATTSQPRETETTTSLGGTTDTPSSNPPETSLPPIVDELKNPHYYTHDKEYTGRVWINIIPTSANEGKQHTVNIIWGTYRYENTFRVGGSSSLVHEKTKPDSVRMDVYVEPAARVEFGVGRPPGKHVIDINDGWTKR